MKYKYNSEMYIAKLNTPNLNLIYSGYIRGVAVTKNSEKDFWILVKTIKSKLIREMYE